MTDARPSRTVNRRRLLLLVVAVAVGVALTAVLGAAGRTTHASPRPADQEAASFADGYLRSQLASAAHPNPSDKSDGPVRVEAVLRSIAQDGLTGSYESILIGSRNGQSFPVAVYSYWANRSFFGGEPYYGRVCRIYTVDRGQVSSESVEYPESVPSEPGGQTLSRDGWPN